MFSFNREGPLRLNVVEIKLEPRLPFPSDLKQQELNVRLSVLN